jgi:4-amino-4-deoxy-L-arabinose transferase-like glycosyltransferase
MKNYSWLWYALLILVFMIGFIIRMSDLFDAPLDFHPTRQLHSALIARGMYYQTLEDVPEWKREMSYKQWQAEGLIEPQIMERLTALIYGVIGSEQLWVARLWAILFWMIAGLLLFLITEKISGFAAGTFAVMYFFVWPYAAAASRAFQPEPLLIASILAALWALLNWVEKENTAWSIIAGVLCGFSIYVKSSAFFFLIPCFIGLIIYKYGLKAALKNRQVWLIGILSILPFLAYLFYGEFVLGILGDQFSYRFFPNRWFDPFFYVQKVFIFTCRLPNRVCYLWICFFLPHHNA